MRGTGEEKRSRLRSRSDLDREKGWCGCFPSCFAPCMCRLFLVVSVSPRIIRPLPLRPVSRSRSFLSPAAALLLGAAAVPLSRRCQSGLSCSPCLSLRRSAVAAPAGRRSAGNAEKRSETADERDGLATRRKERRAQPATARRQPSCGCRRNSEQPLTH